MIPFLWFIRFSWCVLERGFWVTIECLFGMRTSRWKTTHSISSWGIHCPFCPVMSFFYTMSHRINAQAWFQEKFVSQKMLYVFHCQKTKTKQPNMFSYTLPSLMCGSSCQNVLPNVIFIPDQVTKDINPFESLWYLQVLLPKCFISLIETASFCNPTGRVRSPDQLKVLLLTIKF